MDIYDLKNLKVHIDRDSVLRAIDCQKNSPIYEEIQEEYEAIVAEVLPGACPTGCIGFAEMPESIATEAYPAGTKIAYGVLSIGDKICKYSTEAFQAEDYVRGMLCDAIADEALFSLEQDMVEQLKLLCQEKKVGVEQRLEAPDSISMLAQREAWKFLELKDRYGIDITSGDMFNPIKTSCQIFVLTSNEETFHAEHNCRKCTNFKCPRRNVQPLGITLKQGSQKHTVFVKDSQSLLEAIIQSGMEVSAPCGGNGKCGKCRVQILHGKTYAGEKDRTHFTDEEIANGWRLACELYPTEELTIFIPWESEEQFEIVGVCHHAPGIIPRPSTFGMVDVAVDLGTTTLAFELLDHKNGDALYSATMINHQRKYGADVITRIKVSVDGKRQALQKSICADLTKGIHMLQNACGFADHQIHTISLAGNTTMIHLLMGYDCASLGVYPFKPVNINAICMSAPALLADSSLSDVTQMCIFPGISTYVGGDIVSGLYAYGFAETEDICLLIDLGTNGEMALGNRDKILVTSTAAGPAFEGGNITWGTGSVHGAICAASGQEPTKIDIKTIGDKTPCGICGTGVLEIMAFLLESGLVDETGLLDDDYFESGFPVAETRNGEQIMFTQQDIREVQLAKAAIRAGVETLILRYGISKDQIRKVYLAGGFGYHLDTQKAIRIGMLPAELGDRMEAIGNSSLTGAEKALQDAGADKKIQHIISVAQEIGLSSDQDFTNFFMESMLFTTM